MLGFHDGLLISFASGHWSARPEMTSAGYTNHSLPLPSLILAFRTTSFCHSTCGAVSIENSLADIEGHDVATSRRSSVFLSAGLTTVVRELG